MNRVRMLLALGALVLSLSVGAGTAVAGSAVAQDTTATCDDIASQQAQIDASEAEFFAALGAARAQLDLYEATYIPLYNSLITAYAAYPDAVATYTTARDNLITTIANARAYYDNAEADFTARVAAGEAALAALAVAYDC